MSNKKRVKTVIKHSFEGGADLLMKREHAFEKAMQAKMTELVTKHNELGKIADGIEKQFQMLAKFCATEFGRITGQTQAVLNVLGESMDHMDLNVLALVEVNRYMFAELVKGNDWEEKLAEVTKQAFATCKARRDAEEEARNAAREKAKEEAEKSAKDKAEAEKVEKELLDASKGDKSIQTILGGGQGAPIPEGADVFGG